MLLYRLPVTHNTQCDHITTTLYAWLNYDEFSDDVRRLCLIELPNRSVDTKQYADNNCYWSDTPAYIMQSYRAYTGMGYGATIVNINSNFPTY